MIFLKLLNSQRTGQQGGDYQVHLHLVTLETYILLSVTKRAKSSNDLLKVLSTSSGKQQPGSSRFLKW